MLKDDVLNNLPSGINVAQFISFDPTGIMRYNRIRGCEINTVFDSNTFAINKLFEHSPDKTVNIRSFKPTESKSCPFFQNIKTTDHAVTLLAGLWLNGYHTIIHETVNISDNGVSGVIMGDVVEFSPDATPRCVESEGTCRLPYKLFINMIETVYGINLLKYLPLDIRGRVEFSIHPISRGYLNHNVIIWEVDTSEVYEPTKVNIVWPNNFSRMIGDKVFGLLVANALGFPVPRTTVINRRVAPFTFGQQTGAVEKWTRSCPSVQEPGFYPTEFGWTDPFEMANYFNKYPDHISKIQSIISQDHVEALYSGAVRCALSGDLIIEGVSGRGDVFMSGCGCDQVPLNVKTLVAALYLQLESTLGPVRIEWVCDMNLDIYIVQLHIDTDMVPGEDVIVAGDVMEYIKFNSKEGLGKLRELIASSQYWDLPCGINVVGNIGVTSHFGDLLRKSKIPSKITRV